MSIRLSGECVQLLQIVKGLQIDGRDVPFPPKWEIEKVCMENPECSEEDAKRRLEADKRRRDRYFIHPRGIRGDGVFRHDPVPQHILTAELHPYFRQYEGPLAELKARGLVETTDRRVVRFGEYKRIDGLVVDVRPGKHWNAEGCNKWVDVFIRKPDEENICPSISFRLEGERSLIAYQITSKGLAILDELDGNDPLPDEGGKVIQEPKKKGARAGRPPTSDPKEDKRLVDNWKSSGRTKDDYEAETEGVKKGDVDRASARLRSSRRKGGSSS